MEGFPKISFIREKLAHLSEQEIREEERRIYDLCVFMNESKVDITVDDCE